MFESLPVWHPVDGGGLRRLEPYRAWPLEHLDTCVSGGAWGRTRGHWCDIPDDQLHLLIGALVEVLVPRHGLN